MKPAFNSELVIQLCGAHSNMQLFVTPWSGDSDKSGDSGEPGDSGESGDS